MFFTTDVPIMMFISNQSSQKTTIYKWDTVKENIMKQCTPLWNVYSKNVRNSVVTNCKEILAKDSISRKTTEIILI